MKQSLSIRTSQAWKGKRIFAGGTGRSRWVLVLAELGPQRTLCPTLESPASGSLMPPCSSAGGRRLTAALGSTVARVAEAGALLLPEPSVEALPAAPHCGHSTALAVRGPSSPCCPALLPLCWLCCPCCTGRAHECLHRPCTCMHRARPAHTCPAAATHEPLEAARCPLTLAVPARVARGTGALAAAHVEAPAVPAAHATGVPGHLWKRQSGSEGVRGGGSITRVMQEPW